MTLIEVHLNSGKSMNFNENQRTNSKIYEIHRKPYKNDANKKTNETH